MTKTKNLLVVGVMLIACAPLFAQQITGVSDSNDVSLQGSAPEITGFSANRPNLVGNPNFRPEDCGANGSM